PAEVPGWIDARGDSRAARPITQIGRGGAAARDPKAQGHPARQYLHRPQLRRGGTPEGGRICRGGLPPEDWWARELEGAGYGGGGHRPQLCCAARDLGG